MPARHHRPAVFDLPSPSIFGLIVLAALVLGTFFFPFVFHAFGPTDNPFDKPMELLWITVLTAGFIPGVLLVVIARRRVLKMLDI